VCIACISAPSPILSTWAPYHYGGQLAVALKRLKYQRRAEVARALAPLYRPGLQRASQHATVIVPIPLHWMKFVQRTFNQAHLLTAHAGPLACPVKPRLLRRRQRGKAQAGLSRAQRLGNLGQAFHASRSRCRGERVLLVDDVISTGATARAAAAALRLAGAEEVLLFAVARAE